MARRKIQDKYPNFLSGSIVTSAANTFTTSQVFTPIPRLKTTGNKATVMELLWLDVEVLGTDLIANGDDATFQLTIGSEQSTLLNWNDPRVLMDYNLEVGLATSGMNLLIQPHRYLFQSVDGFGYLLASDSFHQNLDSTGQAGVITARWKLFYRFVEIPLSEFVGLVQSTQQS